MLVWRLLRLSNLILLKATRRGGSKKKDEWQRAGRGSLSRSTVRRKKKEGLELVSFVCKMLGSEEGESWEERKNIYIYVSYVLAAP